MRHMVRRTPTKVRNRPWAIVEPLLPAAPPNPKGGRPRVPDRACLTGIIFALKTGIPWEYLWAAALA